MRVGFKIWFCLPALRFAECICEKGNMAQLALILRGNFFWIPLDSFLSAFSG